MGAIGRAAMRIAGWLAAGPRRLALAGVAAGLCAGLGAGTGAARAGELVVGAAASLREPVEWLAEAQRRAHPETTLRVSFGASSVIAAQIRLGAPLDAFLSANRALVEDLVARDRVAEEDVFAFARNGLVVIAPSRGAAALADPGRLSAPSIARIALPSAAVPLGRYARAWLDAEGLLAAVREKIVVTEHARSTLAAVDAGHADLGIVYATDARASTRSRVVYVVPPSRAPEIAYYAARTLTGRRNRDTQAFIAALQGPAFAEALHRAGFLPVPADDARAGETARP